MRRERALRLEESERLYETRVCKTVFDHGGQCARVSARHDHASRSGAYLPTALEHGVAEAIREMEVGEQYAEGARDDERQTLAYAACFSHYEMTTEQPDESSALIAITFDE